MIKKLSNEMYIKYLKIFQLTEDEVKSIVSKFRPIYIKKGDAFCRIGQCCNSLGVLIDGIMYASYEAGEAEEKVSRFFNVNNNFIVSSFESFSQNIKAKETIIAIENSFLLCITYKDLEILYSEIPSMNKIGRKLAEQSYIQAMLRIHNLHALDAKQRIEEFYKEHKYLLGRVQVGHIASYLGMNRNRYTELLKSIQIKSYEKV